MATININTQSAGYQNRLTQLQDIKSFYAPIIREYLQVHYTDRAAARAWRQRDPILRELLEIWHRIQTRDEGGLPGDL